MIRLIPGLVFALLALILLGLLGMGISSYISKDDRGEKGKR